MPGKRRKKHLDFVAIDEIQMCADHERGHIFTDRLLNMRGTKLTMLMGSNTIKKIISNLDEDIEFITADRLRATYLSSVASLMVSRMESNNALITFA